MKKLLISLAALTGAVVFPLPPFAFATYQSWAEHIFTHVQVGTEITGKTPNGHGGAYNTHWKYSYHPQSWGGMKLNTIIVSVHFYKSLFSREKIHLPPRFNLGDHDWLNVEVYKEKHQTYWPYNFWDISIQAKRRKGVTQTGISYCWGENSNHTPTCSPVT